MIRAYRILTSAAIQIEDIYRFTSAHWDDEQAERYVRALFDRFQAIADETFPWRRIPAEFGVDGYVCRCGRHFIYWRILADGDVGIVAILHERMHQIERFRGAFGD